MKSKFKAFSSTMILAGSLLLLFAGHAAAENIDEKKNPVVLKVPAEIRRYKLRIGGKKFVPKNPTLEVEPYGRGRKMYVELLDGNNRTVYQGFRSYEEDALSGMKIRQFSVDVKAGTASLNNKNLGRIYGGDSMGFSTVGVQWQPSLLGIGVSSGGYYSNNCYSFGPCGRFKFSITGAGLVLETAPFTGGAPFFQRLHLALTGGVSSVSTSYEIRERDVVVKDQDQSVGKYAQFEFRIPVVSRIWIDIQHGYQEIPVHLKTLNYKSTIFQNTHALGVRYAF